MQETIADLAYRHAMRPEGPSIRRVSLHVAKAETWRIGVLYQPMFGVVLRGAKQVVIGNRTLRYDSNNFLIASIDVPASRVMIEDAPEAPYVAVRLAVDPDILSDLVIDSPGAHDGETTAFSVGAMTPELLDAWSRMLRLLDAPNEIDTLAPLIEREILIRLLQGPQGALLRQAASAGSRISHVRAAIAHLRSNLDRGIRIEELADIAGMSPATFHRHFRAATATSPLQYQKALRLQEARRLLADDVDATSAAFAVGYVSPSQFSREYKLMFGMPPRRDAARLRARHE